MEKRKIIVFHRPYIKGEIGLPKHLEYFDDYALAKAIDDYIEDHNISIDDIFNRYWNILATADGFYIAKYQD